MKNLWGRSKRLNLSDLDLSGVIVVLKKENEAFWREHDERLNMSNIIWNISDLNLSDLDLICFRDHMLPLFPTPNYFYHLHRHQTSTTYFTLILREFSWS